MLGFKEDFCQCLTINLKTNSFISVLSTTMADSHTVSFMYQGVTFLRVITFLQKLVVLVNVK